MKATWDLSRQDCERDRDTDYTSSHTVRTRPESTDAQTIAPPVLFSHGRARQVPGASPAVAGISGRIDTPFLLLERSMIRRSVAI